MFYDVKNYLDHKDTINILTQIQSELEIEYLKNRIDIDSLYNELEILKKQKEEQIKKEIWEIGRLRINRYHNTSVTLLKINKVTVKYIDENNKTHTMNKSDYANYAKSFE
jgi:hypothetical protein